jgi:hypothetical protein
MNAQVPALVDRSPPLYQTRVEVTVDGDGDCVRVLEYSLVDGAPNTLWERGKSTAAALRKTLEEMKTRIAGKPPDYDHKLAVANEYARLVGKRLDHATIELA